MVSWLCQLYGYLENSHNCIIQHARFQKIEMGDRTIIVANDYQFKNIPIESLMLLGNEGCFHSSYHSCSNVARGWQGNGAICLSKSVLKPESHKKRSES